MPELEEVEGGKAVLSVQAACNNDKAGGEEVLAAPAQVQVRCKRSCPFLKDIRG